MVLRISNICYEGIGSLLAEFGIYILFLLVSLARRSQGQPLQPELCPPAVQHMLREPLWWLLLPTGGLSCSPSALCRMISLQSTAARRRGSEANARKPPPSHDKESEAISVCESMPLLTLNISQLE